jgi:hypothetical protein
MSSVLRQERFEAYRDLWCRLCELGGRLRHLGDTPGGLASALHRKVEAEYVATLDQIRERQAAWNIGRWIAA